jgi:large subunit ribosomal protein L22
MEVFALASGVRTTPRKARLVAATVVGLPVQEALTVLAFTPRAAAVDVAKVIKSAAANAEHNYELDLESLRVKSIEVNGGRTIKRFRPRAQGRAFTILKRTVHMRAVVTDEGAPVERPTARRRAAAAAAPAPRKTVRPRASAAATEAANEAAELAIDDAVIDDVQTDEVTQAPPPKATRKRAAGKAATQPKKQDEAAPADAEVLE